MAQLGRKTWMKHGALSYFECTGDDMKIPWGLGFPKMCKIKKDETVVFAFITFKSKAHRKLVNAKVHKEFGELYSSDSIDMPFDANKVAYAGFKTIVQG